MKIVKHVVGSVVIEGRQIPRLSANEQPDGRVELVLDGRFGATFADLGVAGQAAWLVANALAIGEGYSFLGASDKNHPFAPECLQMDVRPNLKSVPTDSES
jgi:hypothetical protein